MSLKALHIIFVVASTLLCIAFGAWAMGQVHDGGNSYLLAGVLAFVAAASLPVYGWWFLKKLKGVSFL